MSAKPKTPPQRARTGRAAAPQKPRGNMSRAEITPLVLEAKAALLAQIELANIDPQTDFDAWRRDEVLKAVGKPGISACDSDDYNKIMAHFAELAGHDELALEHRLKSGKVKDHGDPNDTHEARRTLAALIMQNLRAHIRLGEISAADLAAETEDTAEYQSLRAARDAIRSHKDGPIREGYVVVLARAKTRRRDLTLGRDIQAGLADRCEVKDLRQILSTLRSRISTREGRADEKKREPGKKRAKAKRQAKARALDTPAGTAHRIAKPAEDDPF
jgi:hypothetical protein